MPKPLIIYAEDTPHMQLPVSMKLQNEGYDVMRCADGQEAYDTLQMLAAQGRKADLLLTDHEMPKMTGEELVRAVKKLPEGILKPDMPIIMMTTHTEVPERLKADGIEVEFLDKGVTVGKLAAAVKEALQKSGVAVTAPEPQDPKPFAERVGRDGGLPGWVKNN